MSHKQTHTLPSAKPAQMSVRSLRIEVAEGPDTGKSVVTTSERVTIGTADGNDLVLTDPTVSRFHGELTRRDDGVLVVDHESTNGTLAGTIRLQRAVVQPSAVLTLGRSQLRISDGERVEVELIPGEELGNLRGRAPVMRRLLAQVNRAAQSDVSVLLVGESGTGKERIARALHDLGPRAKAPFETVDCASLSPTLVASELFGHERGAFTGADRRHTGAFERANGGTIFLDEIGELPESLQPALLGVLERKKFRRLGGREEISIDARVATATNRDLRAEVNAGRFRLDLFYRIAVVRLDIPALRDRPEDIPLLVEHFAREAGHRGEISAIIPASTMQALLGHFWPGNVRELRNVVEATLAMGETPALDLWAGGASQPPPPPPPPASGAQIVLTPVLDLNYKDARAGVLTQFELAYLTRLLERSEGNVSQAARDADMDRSHLWEMLRRHGLR